MAATPNRSNSSRAKSAPPRRSRAACPAMCDGVTQGQAGMDLSLFSRDNIAQGTAIALSHAMFESVLLLGICDKIVPGLLIGALRFGHLPQILIPAGPMPSGLANKEKQRVRQLYAEGKATPRRTARRRSGELSWRGHLHLLRHRQQQPDDDGADGAAHPRQRLHQSRHQAAPGTDPRRDAPGGRRSAGTATTIARWRAASTRRRSSTPRSACSRPAARPTMRSTCPRSRARRGSSSTGRISTS